MRVCTPLYSWSPSVWCQLGLEWIRRTFEQHEVVCIAVMLFKGELGCIVVLYLPYGGGELCPGVLDGCIWADLRGEWGVGVYGRTFLQAKEMM